MKASAILPGLMRLDAVLDGALLFYIPNQRAVRETLKRVGAQSTKADWKETFTIARAVHPRPAEKVTGATIKVSNGQIFTHP